MFFLFVVFGNMLKNTLELCESIGKLSELGGNTMGTLGNLVTTFWKQQN
jgi:hypothetical protein